MNAYLVSQGSPTQRISIYRIAGGGWGLTLGKSVHPYTTAEKIEYVILNFLWMQLKTDISLEIMPENPDLGCRVIIKIASNGAKYDFSIKYLDWKGALGREVSYHNVQRKDVSPSRMSGELAEQLGYLKWNWQDYFPMGFSKQKGQTFEKWYNMNVKENALKGHYSDVAMYADRMKLFWETKWNTV